jgi:hypothetical protein
MPLPKFSVITVSYNQGEFIRQTIESVLNQNYPNFEHLVIDAGSTDNTLEILKRYPHLKWTSEPDRGQSHGLNKGFTRATGEVIAWINSDDWYAPGAFAEVARHIASHPIVLGTSVVTNREGEPQEQVLNLERSWFDTLKYWVFNSVPAQPGVFFRRDVFHALGITPAEALDEGLEFTMDFDFWLRVQERIPFAFRTPHTLAFMRNYDTNKTGANSTGVYREMSRVFRRHVARRCPPEQSLSWVVPFDGPFDPRPMLEGISKQGYPGQEVLFVDYSWDRSIVRQVRKAVLALENDFPNLALRISRTDNRGARARSTAIARGIDDAGAPVVVVYASGAQVGQDLARQLVSLFATDSLGLVLLSLSDDQKEVLFKAQGGHLVCNPLGPFSLTLSDLQFAIRKVTWRDIQTLFSPPASASASLLYKRIVVHALHSAWHVTLHDSGAFKATPTHIPLHNDPNRLFENCVVVNEVVRSVREKPFVQHRVKTGFALSFPEDLANMARAVCEDAPAEWNEFATFDLGTLEKLVASYPRFGPARHRLHSVRRDHGDVIGAQADLEIWRTMHAQELGSPLIGAR